MAVFNFPFPYQAAGLAVTVKDDDGNTVDTGTLDARAGSSRLDLVHQSSLPLEGAYTGEVESDLLGGVFEVQGQLDIPDSLDTPGAAETAYFVATGPVYATDGGGSAGTLVFEADDRQGALPTWASIVDGDIELTPEAGTCAFAVNGLFDFDFSATTPQDSSGNLQNAFTLNIDGNPFAHNNATKAGDGQDAQTSAPDIFGGLLVGALVSCEAYPFADDVTDGTATPRVGLTITRLAPAPVLPA